MRRSLLTFTLLTAIVGPIAGDLAFGADTAPADAPKHAKGEGRREPLKRLEANLAKLDLTADQQKKVDGIIADAKTQLQALRQQAKNGDKSALKDQARQIITKAWSDIEAVLTPEQQAKLKELRKEERKEHQEEQGEKGDKGPHGDKPAN